ncbi:hypothetical protein BDP55DRAFT_664819 [Colletotrichum godetiae]|uniref:SnoaL-like domain-containing protein n=1 Tax=Colletotrichum godetiae TaxID=1209918 RepID=A0AAJ0AKZ6_9PEZI|nr:uncharacterized protein BDP55DRAFT_664819 [Colletotrichum godetiae]KAK1675194.1 hypothetical protein BDP55DRAFT_664819 [Colletotrichum godetiae]
MRTSSLLAFGVSALAWTTSALAPRQGSAPYCPPRPATPEQQKVILAEFMQAFYEERNATKALLNHVAEDYIQHNPGALSGRANSLAVLEPFISPNTVNYTIMNKNFQDNIAFIHYRMDLVGGGQPFAVVDVFRFNGTCVMEHWDVAQQRTANSTNPIALF